MALLFYDTVALTLLRPHGFSYVVIRLDDNHTNNIKKKVIQIFFFFIMTLFLVSIASIATPATSCIDIANTTVSTTCSIVFISANTLTQEVVTMI